MTALRLSGRPCALLDEVGLDVAEKAGSVMYEAFGERMKPAGALSRMLGATRLGRKNGRGFYKYQRGPQGRSRQAACTRSSASGPGMPTPIWCSEGWSTPC